MKAHKKVLVIKIEPALVMIRLMMKLEEQIIILYIAFLELRKTVMCISSLDSHNNPVGEIPVIHFKI